MFTNRQYSMVGIFLRKKRKQNREYYIHKDIFTKGGRVL